MKSCLWIATLLAFSAVPAFAGNGNISDSALAKCGLHGMKVMSDRDGLAIRGKSVTVVVTSSVNGADSTAELAVSGNSFSVTFNAKSAVSNANHTASSSLKGSAKSK
jgi:hypothetical protein